MNATHDDNGLPSSLSTRLRHEARSTRPGFSDALHARLIDRVAREQVSLLSCDNDVGPLRSAWLSRFTIPIAAGAAFAVVLSVLVTVSVPEQALNSSVSREAAGRPGVDDVPPLGVESIPLYDDIDAGMRAGVWMLASSLVEMPDWATLADFDADAESRDAQGP